ncbi:MAG: ribonuclease P protein component [Proteobacteria bacterium]|nr:ribonuclease P protein component [Pseudomonadota bacterium]
MLPKRWARRAVTRNTLRRQIYSVAAEFEPRLAQAAHLVRLRSGFDRRLFPSATSEALRRAVRTELQQLLASAALSPAAPTISAGAAS